MSCITLDLNIAAPILLDLVVDDGYVIVPNQVPGSEPLFTGSEAFKFEDGDKAKLDGISAATTEEINAGTEAAKYVAPSALAGSLYRRVHIQTDEPVAPSEGDLWIVKRISI